MHVLKANNLYTARLGIGLLPPKHDEISGFGHIWLYWKTPEKEHHPPFRGYYPVRECLPQELDYENRRQWLRALIKLVPPFVKGGLGGIRGGEGFASLLPSLVLSLACPPKIEMKTMLVDTGKW